MARTFVLIAPVQPILHRASCSNEIIHNAPKHYETHQNMSFGSNAMDWVHSLQQIPMQLREVTKQFKMHPDTSKRTNARV